MYVQCTCPQMQKRCRRYNSVMEIFTSSSQHLSIGCIYGICTTLASFCVRRGGGGWGGVWEYNVTTMYNIHPGLWNIFRALWIVSGECKRSRSAVSVLSCYDVQSPIPPPCFERGVLSADGLLKCLGLFHADLIMSKRGD